MKTSKRFLSIVLMLAMLVSMFTVMAFAGDDAAPEHDCKNVATKVAEVAATCATEGKKAHWHCNTCNKDYVGESTDNWTEVTSAELVIKKHNLSQDDVVHANDFHSAYVHCTACDKYFSVPNGNIDSVDLDHPKDSADAFLILPEPCAHNEIEYHEAADGYSAYGYCPDCGKYYAAWDGSAYDFSNPQDSKKAFKLTPMPVAKDDEAKLTVRISGRGTVKVKIYGEWEVVEDGEKIENFMPFVDEDETKREPLSKGGILNFKAICGSNYSVEWTLNNRTTSTESTFDATLKAGDNTLWVVFTKNSSHTSHTWEENYNDTYHWKECKYCGAVKSGSKVKHDLYSYTKYGYTYKYCKNCGYDSYTYDYDKHPSSHDSYVYTDLNASYHLKECAKKGCSYEVKEYHTWIKNTDRKTKDSYPYVCKYCDRLSKTAYTDLPFRDVDGNVWYYDDVLYAYINGYMDGLSAGQFAPNQNTTRAQIVTILWRLTGEPRATKSNKFNDVASSAYYDKAVSWAVEAGVVNGFDAKTFKPNDYVTREQLAAILYRYAEYMNVSTRGASNLTKYDDYYQIGTWARDAMAWANYHGLINGVSYTRIDPKGYATRAQVAAILHRFAVEFGNY